MIKTTKLPLKGDFRIITEFKIFPISVKITKGKREYIHTSGWFKTVNVLQWYTGEHSFSTECKWENIFMIEESKSKIKELNQIFESENKDDIGLALGIIGVKISYNQ